MEQKIFLQEKSRNLPSTSGVYLMKNIAGEIIYVGKAKNLKKRVSTYFDGRIKQIKVSTMASNVQDFDFISTENESDAFALECNLIKKYMPKYNVLLKDDKAYPYITINKKKPFPTFSITRKIKNDGSTYFGPYVTNMRVSELLKIINESFLLRTCKLQFPKKSPQKRMCIEGDMARCMAPCVGRVNEEEYKKAVEEACDFLKGKTTKIIKILKEKMKKHAENQNFEAALVVRDQIETVKRTGQTILTNLPKTLDIDVFSFAENEIKVVGTLFIRGGKTIGSEIISLEEKEGTPAELLSSVVAQSYPSIDVVPNEILVSEDVADLLTDFFEKKFSRSPSITNPKRGIKQKIVEYAKHNAEEFAKRNVDKLISKQKNTEGALFDLKDMLGIDQKVYRIEGYDISNISGTSAVASMVVFEGGVPAKKEYRKFKIKTVEGPNDFESMKEVIKRRFSKDESFGKLPDLVLIDGGLGQLHSAAEAMAEVQKIIPIISLAKKEELIYTTSSNNPIALSKNEPALKLLQRVRDESHRFAIEYHRKLRDKKIFETTK